MKKWIIAVVAVLVVGLVLLIWPITKRLATLRYVDQVEYHQRHGLDSTTAVSFGGKPVLLHPQNLDALCTAITRKGVEKVRAPKVPEAEACVVVTFADGAEFTIFEGEAASNGDDVAYILYTYEGKKTCIRLLGYKTVERVAACASLEGYYVENTAADGADGNG